MRRNKSGNLDLYKYLWPGSVLDQLECNNDLEKASIYICHRRWLCPQVFSGLHQHTYSATRSHKCRNTPNDPLWSYALDKDEVEKFPKCCQIRRHYLKETIPLKQISQICKSTQNIS